VTDDRLRGLINAVRAYNEEIADAVAGRRGVFEQAKAMGYDPKTMRQLIRRMGMAASDREAADELLAQYECAMGIAGAVEPHADGGPAERKREPYTAPATATTEEQLRAVISRVLGLRAERSERGQEIRLELRKAKVAGFDPRKITEACTWLERCDTHGRDRMLAIEELFQTYRDIGDGPRAPVAIEGDSKLVAMFAGDPQPEAKAVTLKQRQVGDAIAFAQISRRNRGIV